MGTISQMEAKIDARKKVEAYRKRYSELREKDMDDFDASAQAYNETLVGEGKDPSMSINRMLETVGQRDYHRAMIHQGEEKISNQLGLAETAQARLRPNGFAGSHGSRKDRKPTGQYWEKRSAQSAGDRRARVHCQPKDRALPGTGAVR